MLADFVGRQRLSAMLERRVLAGIFNFEKQDLLADLYELFLFFLRRFTGFYNTRLRSIRRQLRNRIIVLFFHD